ncbi:MAG: hypothetical protein HWN68_14180 [Desulfobacterales bacterium]|nr:hypothetical protein [Desulfobacterales bacterium]
MGTLNIDELKADMIAASDVANKHGNVLLAKGAMLTEKRIMVLKAWGVTEVDVEGVDRDQVERQETEAVPGDVAASIEEEIKQWFPDFGDNPVMKEIYRVVRKFKLRKAALQTNGSADEREKD